MTVFYLLSLLSGFFEIAPFAHTLRTDGILPALIVVLCYQIGNLAPCPLRLSRTAVRGTALIGSAVFAAYTISGIFPLLCVATALMSAAVQVARSVGKADSVKPLKRGLRVAGFGLGFFGAPPALIVAGAVAAVLVFMIKEGYARNELVLPRQNIVNAAMIFHQIHYFSYCYAAIALAVAHTGSVLALGLFLVSWATYILGAGLYRGHGLERSFFIGHTLLAIVLFAMYFVPSMAVKAILWVATGLGGTTEFCIARLARERGGSADSGIFAENLGHVIGVALSAAAYAATGKLLVTILAAAAAALVTIALMAAAIRKEDNEHARANH